MRKMDHTKLDAVADAVGVLADRVDAYAMRQDASVSSRIALLARSADEHQGRAERAREEGNEAEFKRLHRVASAYRAGYSVMRKKQDAGYIAEVARR